MASLTLSTLPSLAVTTSKLFGGPACWVIATDRSDAGVHTLGVHGTYSFVLPDLGPGAVRELRDPDN
jgi:hypothetical protein